MGKIEKTVLIILAIISILFFTYTIHEKINTTNNISIQYIQNNHTTPAWEKLELCMTKEEVKMV